MTTTYSPRRMAGPCANGAERNGGVRWHAVPADSFRAVCGARTKSFWSDEVGKAVTCPRCLKKLAKLEPPAESPRHFDVRPVSASAYARALEHARREHVCDDDCRSNGCKARF